LEKVLLPNSNFTDQYASPGEAFPGFPQMVTAAQLTGMIVLLSLAVMPFLTGADR
jgi:hypothetical protein